MGETKMEFKGTEILVGTDTIMISNGFGTGILIRKSITDKLEYSTDGNNWKHFEGERK